MDSGLDKTRRNLIIAVSLFTASILLEIQIEDFNGPFFTAKVDNPEIFNYLCFAAIFYMWFRYYSYYCEDDIHSKYREAREHRLKQLIKQDFEKKHKIYFSKVNYHWRSKEEFYDTITLSNNNDPHFDEIYYNIEGNSFYKVVANTEDLFDSSLLKAKETTYSLKNPVTSKTLIYLQKVATFTTFFKHSHFGYYILPLWSPLLIPVGWIYYACSDVLFFVIAFSGHN